MRVTFIGMSRIRRALGPTIRDKWFIAVRRRRQGQGLPTDMDGFRIVVAPRGHYYADPFLLPWQDREYLFFEDFSFAHRLGRILYCEVFPDASLSKPSVALECDYHLSYPSVREIDGQIYMVPETSQRERVAIYHAPTFPGRFHFLAPILGSQRLVDPTLVRWQERLWLFGTDCSDGGNCRDRLDLFWSDDLRGPWHPHPANPVMRDIAGARSAGQAIIEDGRLIRPAQDCSRRYGEAVVFRQVVRLDPSGYEEREVGRISPGWLPDNLATHTYNRSARFEVVDGLWLTSERRWFDLTVKGASRFLELRTASAVRGSRGWKVPVDHADGPD